MNVKPRFQRELPPKNLLLCTRNAYSKNLLEIILWRSENFCAKSGKTEELKKFIGNFPNPEVPADNTEVMKKSFFSKIILPKSSSRHVNAVLMTLPIFFAKSLRDINLKSKKDGKDLSPSKIISAAVEGSLSTQTQKEAKNPRSVCWWSKNEEIDENFKIYVSRRIWWTRSIQFWQFYRNVWRSKPTPIIAWSPWMWNSDSKQMSLPKSSLGTRNTWLENLPEIYGLM